MKFLIYAFFVVSFINTNTYAYQFDFDTTRLKSTAGAGVGSMLMDEATMLNPAPIAFYNISSVYVSSSKTQFLDTNDKNTSKGHTLAIIGSDAKGPIKGSIAYHQMKYFGEENTRWSAAMAGPIGPRSSLGFWGRRVKISNNPAYYQIAIGAFHAIDEQFSFGAVFIDPLKSQGKDSKLQIGGQYLFKGLVALILDVGGNPYERIEQKNFIKAAVQLKIFSDIYFRAGLFKDKVLEETGSAIGGGWLSPKLNIDAALKSVRSTNDKLILSSEEMQRKEISFSLSYRF